MIAATAQEQQQVYTIILQTAAWHNYMAKRRKHVKR